MIETLIKKIWNPNKRELNKLERRVETINAHEEEMKELSDEELKALTKEFKERLSENETLDDILPEAFAAVREAAQRTLGMRHYDVQMIGGMVLHEGRIAEMKTGEGKTLVATSPVYLNALTGKGVHLITVNDYLARRDGHWMGKIYDFMGLTVGIINHDVCYLYDASVEGEEKLRPATRQEVYAADITYGTNNEFGFDYLRDNMVMEMGHRVQRGHYFTIVDEVDSILIDEARTPLIISGRGEDVEINYERYARLATRLEEETHYTVEGKSKSANLTDEGIKLVEKSLEIDNLYDISNAQHAHLINNAIRAEACYRRDSEYVVQEDEVIIVDENRGRLMYGRRYSDGLHQAIEAKEGVRVRSQDKTLASITFQNYFKLYEKLSGMTGTAETEEREFREVYNIDVVVIPTNKPVVRDDIDDVIFKNQKAKFKAVLQEISEEHETGRPILVGTRSIQLSEFISHLLKEAGIEHKVLNAKYHAQEAEIVAQAGRLGAVTIATNMAGRGTDIVLGGVPLDEAKAKEVKELGGLCIIGTERHESRRIDNQLRGRSGRQGDPGSSQFFLALDDELLRIFNGEMIQGLMEKLDIPEDEPITNMMVTRSVESAQKRIEGHFFEGRKNVLKFDDAMNDQRKQIYGQRDRILEGDLDFGEQVLGFLEDLAKSWVYRHCNPQQPEQEWGIDDLYDEVIANINVPDDADADELDDCEHPDQMVECIVAWAQEYYEEKESQLGEQMMRSFERYVMLDTLDRKWIEHLDALEHLRQGIGLRAYGQKDPVIEFIRESSEMWEELNHRIKEDCVKFLFKLEIRVQEPEEERSNYHITKTTKEEGGVSSGGGSRARKSKKLGRNDPCWCGSGKKWKKCHFPEGPDGE